MNMLFLFTICTIGIVILSTIKSIVTIRGSKLMASLVCAITQGFNIYIVFLTACDNLGIWPKIIITIICNLIGVYIVKYFEEKLQKDKLWKIEFTVPAEFTDEIHNILNGKNKFGHVFYGDTPIPHSYISISPKHTLFNCYCNSRFDSELVRMLVEKYNAKWFVSESKSLF